MSSGATLAPGARRRAQRHDALPENHQYYDIGCSAHPACLSCSEPTCILELNRRTPGYLRRDRNRRILRLYAQGHTVDQLASAFFLSRRSLYRVVATPAP